MREVFKKLKKITPPFFIDRYHFFLALLAALFYGFPSRKLKVIGVTGTNGKTTTIDLISMILEKAGYKVAALSSIKFKIKEREWKNELRMTMPGRMVLQRFLKQALKANCQYVILEVTSEGIKQHRHRFIDFDVAVLTNLTPEHLEAHKGFENYRAAKGKLFGAVKKVHIVNSDDKNVEYFLQFPAEEEYEYGLKAIVTPKVDLSVRDCSVTPDGIAFRVWNVEFKLKLLGKFNIHNALAAITAALSQGIDLEVCKKALEEVGGIPGRMELVISNPFKVFVDYAFTPNALGQVYQTIRESFARKKMICVLGACGGGRDKWKRPILGELAGKHCDEVIVTNEDPYDEDPLEIINQVASGAMKRAEKILDRREAIAKALKSAEPEDVVVITGKGCEPSICLESGKKIPWDDRQAVKEEFANLQLYN